MLNTNSNTNTAESKDLSRIRALFNGLPRAYGRYREAKQGEKKGSGVTVQAPVTDELWQAHLDGHQRLGIVPIRDDNTCVFGAVDVDDYTVGSAEIARRVAALNAPLVVTRSKSGGAHVWLFLTEPMPAARVRDWLTGVAVAIGYPGAEVFPKQTALASKEDVGNWIHMPWFDATRTLCGGIAPDGTLIGPLSNWLDIAEAAQVDTLPEIELEEQELLEGAPPCLQAFAGNSVPDGQRNVALFAFGVFCQKAHDPGWEDELARMNQSFMVPPLDLGEVNATIKSLTRKKYFYPCNKPPLSGVCNKAICRTLEHGIGNREKDDPGISIESITKFDSEPPSYIVQVNGQRIMVPDSDDLMSQTRFKKLVFERLDVLPNRVKDSVWNGLITALMANAEHIEVPEDAGPWGRLRWLVVKFCTERAMARNRDEILMGRPWRDDKDRVWFRSPDLFTFLDRHRFKAIDQDKIWPLLKTRMGADSKPLNIKGKNERCWYVMLPGEHGQTVPFDVPSFDRDEDPMKGPVQDEPPADWSEYDIGGMH